MALSTDRRIHVPGFRHEYCPYKSIGWVGARLFLIAILFPSVIESGIQLHICSTRPKRVHKGISPSEIRWLFRGRDLKKSSFDIMVSELPFRYSPAGCNELELHQDCLYIIVSTCFCTEGQLALVWNSSDWIVLSRYKSVVDPGRSKDQWITVRT